MSIDRDAISHLIGATNDFSAGAHEYLDGLEGQAIGKLEFDERPKGDREREDLEVSSDALRSSFDELVDTFVEPYRETQPDLAERGYQVLWALMKATSNIVRLTENVKVEDVLDEDKKHRTYSATLKRVQNHETSVAKLVEAVGKAVSQTNHPFAVSVEYAGIIQPAVRSELELLGCPIPETSKWPSVWTIRGVLRDLRFLGQ